MFARRRPTFRGVEVQLADRKLRVGAVINCTGSTPDVRGSSHHLVRELPASRVSRPEPLGLGLDANQDGSVPGTDRRLWVVGPLRRGDRWEVTAIPEIRTQAAALPRQLWSAERRSSPDPDTTLVNLIALDGAARPRPVVPSTAFFVHRRRPLASEPRIERP